MLAYAEIRQLWPTNYQSSAHSGQFRCIGIGARRLVAVLLEFPTRPTELLGHYLERGITILIQKQVKPTPRT